MFQLATLQDTAVKIVPENLGLPRLEALTQRLENTYVDKVIENAGLCVTLYEILSVEGGTVFQGEGDAHFVVKFKLVVFRPFVGEVLIGRIKQSDELGIRITLGFFEDVFVPEHNLQQPAVFSKDDGLWIWKFQENEMFLELDEEVRFRVQSVRFPRRPTSENELKGLTPLEGGLVQNGAPAFAPMVIIGDMNADGLGCLSWWS